MAVRPLRPGDLVFANSWPRPAFGLVVAVEKPLLDDPDNPELRWHYHVVVDERVIRTPEASVWTLVQE